MRRENGEGTRYVIQTPLGERIRLYEPEYDEHGVWTGRRISGSGKTLQEARKALARNKHRRSAHGLARLRRASSPTMEAWASEWLGTAATRESTTRNYRATMYNHVLPVLGDMPLNSITKADITRLIYDVLPSKGTLGQGAIRNAWTVLKLCMNAAVEAEHLDMNPMDRVKAPPKHDSSADREQLQERWVPRELVRHFQDTTDELAWWFTFLGMRPSEKLGVTWDRVKNVTSRGRCYIEVHQTLIYTPGKGYRVGPEMKTKASKREVPMPERVRLLLVKAKAEHEQTKQSNEWKPQKGMELLLWNDKTGAVRTQKKDTAAWSKLLKSRNLPHVRQHACRHFFVSTAISTGSNLPAVKQLVGHAPTSRVTEDIYTHLNMADRKMVIESVMEKLTEKKPVKH